MQHHDDASAFHEGEREVQERVGVRDRAEQLAGHMVRDTMTAQHLEFFAKLPYLFVGSLDANGQPWASVLFGEPGFALPTSASELVIHARALPGDPLGNALALRAPLGLLGIQLETRRRNRLNGRISEIARDAFVVRVDQTFGNCPRYITARAPLAFEARAGQAAREEHAMLSQDALGCIAASDTCFIASASSSAPDLADPREGVDVSHRGGPHGFVHVELRDGVHVLTLPDFNGNNMFNTLGNLTRYPRAGLLFVDFQTGDLLQVICRTELSFEPEDVARFPGAERVTRLFVEGGRLHPQAFPFRWWAAGPSPHSRELGPWLRA